MLCDSFWALSDFMFLLLTCTIGKEQLGIYYSQQNEKKSQLKLSHIIVPILKNTGHYDFKPS